MSASAACNRVRIRSYKDGRGRKPFAFKTLTYSSLARVLLDLTETIKVRVPMTSPFGNQLSLGVKYINASTE